MELKPHEIKSVIAARLGAMVTRYPITQVWLPWGRRDLTGELLRLIALAESLPDKQ